MNKNLETVTVVRQKTDLTWASIAKVPVVALVCYLIYLLLPFAMLLFVSVLLAVTFKPVVEKLSKYMGRKTAVAVITVLAVAVVIAIALLVVPEIVAQATTLYREFPNFLAKMTDRFPVLAEYVQTLQTKGTNVDPSAVSPVVSKIAEFGALAAGSISTLVLIFAFMIYLLLEGERLRVVRGIFLEEKSGPLR